MTINLINDKKYVGSHATDNIDDTYLGSGKLIIKAIKKYGKQNFKRIIIEECKDIETARLLESCCIKKYNTLNPNGYNLHPSGGSYKGSIDNRGVNHPLYGTKLSSERKLKISNSEKGKTVSIETREKISKLNKGKIPWNKGKQGISDETRLKLKNSLTGRKSSNKGKKISDEQKEQISKKLQGRKLTIEHKLNISKATIGKRKKKKS